MRFAFWFLVRAAALAALVGLAGCGGSDDTLMYQERPVEDLYNGGMSAMQAGDYKMAAQYFDQVEQQHPYSIWAPKAQLMAAYAYYLDNKYDDAINALNRYIELHPGSEDTAYAYYLKALCYYEQISDVRRDQDMTRRALAALEEVIRRYPDTTYARDAQLKRDLALDHLAGKEMEVGRYYQKRGSYLAAINRFRIVVKDYQTTSHVPEALHRLVECYLALGVNKEAQATAAVLGYNFPGTDWYTDSYYLLTGVDLRPEAQEGSWISGVWPF